MQNLKWGIIGAGAIAKSLCQYISDNNQSTIIKIYSRNYDNAKKLANSFGCLPTCDYNDIINDIDINAVIIALPDHLHFEVAMKALNSYKNVFIEKPFVRNSDECDILFNIAIQNNLLLFEGMAYKYHPRTKILNSYIQENKSSSPTYINNQVGFRIGRIRDKLLPLSLLLKKYSSDRLLVDDYGALYDLGCYPVSMTNMIVKHMNSGVLVSPIGYEIKSVKNHKDINLSAEIILHYDKNIKATIKYSIIEGLNGKLALHDDDFIINYSRPYTCESKSELNFLSIDLDINYRLKSYMSPMSCEIDHFIQLLHDNKTESPLNTYLEISNNIKTLNCIESELSKHKERKH